MVWDYIGGVPEYGSMTVRSPTFGWREITDAPLRAAAFPSAVWIGSEFVVWLAGEDSDLARLPRSAQGQLAAYDPSTDTWRTLDTPDVAMSDAALLDADGQLALVGGPAMRDVGTVGSRAAVTVLLQDPETGSWGVPTRGPVVEAGRAFRPSEGIVGLLTDLGTAQVLTKTGGSSLGICPRTAGSMSVQYQAESASS
jgi:hypothetical protein